MVRQYRTCSFKIPSKMVMQIQMKYMKKGYGPMGKSRWLCEVISDLLNYHDEQFVLESIDNVEEMTNLDKAMSFRPTEEVEELLSTWVIKARRYNPTIEGVKSKIIRAAIINGVYGVVQSLKRLDAAKSLHET